MSTTQLPNEQAQAVFKEWLGTAGIDLTPDGLLIGVITDSDFHQLIRVVHERALASVEGESIAVTDDMALAFHRALTDGPIGADDLEDIKSGIEAAICHLRPQPAQADAAQGGRVPAAIIAGALFDFAGYLTTRPESTAFGSRDNAAPAADLLKAWADTRGLHLDDALVKSWRQHLAASPEPAAASHEPYTTINMGHGKWEVGAGTNGGIPCIAFGKNGTGRVGEMITLEPRQMSVEETFAVIMFANIDGLNVLQEKMDEVRVAFFGAPASQEQAQQPAQAEAGTVGEREALTIALEALDEIALAGMSGTGQESEEGMRDWHARQAWKFIGIAARAKEAARAALQSAQAVREDKPAGCVKPDTATHVFFYEQDFYVLSNFSAFNLVWRGKTFPTSEAAYHCEKFPADGALRNEIRFAPSAHEAFKIAERNKASRRPDWDNVKVSIMRDILRAKADQHEYVRRKLLATGDRVLVEDSWRDDFWGWGPNRDGQNMLGKLCHDRVEWTQVQCTNDDCAVATESHCKGWEPTPVETWNRRALLRSQQPNGADGERVIWTQDGLSAEAIIIRAHERDDGLRLIRVAGGEHWARAQDLRSQQPGQDEREAFEAFVRTRPGFEPRHLYRKDQAPSERFGQYILAFVEVMWESWQHRARLSAPQAPQFQGVGARKLAELQAQGYGITGYAIRHETTGLRGAIDGHGFVYWWHSAPQAAGADARCLAIGQQMERACKDLPYGWSVIIDLELNAGSVYLYDPDGEQVLITTDGDHSFAEVIDINIDAAIARSAPPTPAGEAG